jgi:osmotically-inducible protein OsmY
MSTVLASSPLSDRIRDALTTNPYLPRQHVRIEATDGLVVLKGSVQSFFQKQMAQE